MAIDLAPAARAYDANLCTPSPGSRLGLPSAARCAGSLARRIGITRQEVNRLTNLKHATKIDRIDAALRALGKRLYLDAA
ncbi:MAG: hypothetical protein KGL37_01880 [Acidobacteriota bacterium]|nr:hypothetical protein [Acidobacteriota bacterium]